MELFRVSFDRAIKVNNEHGATIASLLIAKDIKDCLEGLYEVDIKSNAILVPFKFPNVVEIYNLEKNKVDLIIKRFFANGRTIEIAGENYSVVNSEIKKFIWKERILKGYDNKRINRYKTITPVFFKNLFILANTTNEKIDTEFFKANATREVKAVIANQLNCEEEELVINWEEFNITFSKCSLEEKNQICFFGVFNCNFVPPVFIGDYSENGFGKLILLKSTTENQKKRETLTINFEKGFFEKLKHCSDKRKISTIEFIKISIEKAMKEDDYIDSG